MEVSQTHQNRDNVLGELPKPVHEYLQLPDSDNWWRIIFHLAWHFRRPFQKAGCCRLLSKDGVPAGANNETVARLHGMVGRSDLLPGLIYSALEHDLCTCSGGDPSFRASPNYLPRINLRKCMGIEPTESFVQTPHWF